MSKPLTSHIGSLPFLNVKEAIDYTFKFDLPVLFTLPKLNEADFMQNQAKLFFSESRVDIPYEDEFLTKLISMGKNSFKYQFMGPYTLFKLSNNKDITFIEVITLWQNLIEQIAQRWSKFNVLFMLDEPMLSEADESEIKQIIDMAHKLTFNKIAIHCCGKLAVEMINKFGDKTLLHIDISLYSKDELQRIQTPFLPGLSDKITPEQFFDLLGFAPSYIMPACGFALEKQAKLLDLLGNLELVRLKYSDFIV